jgi:hypothetical protein
VDRIPQDKPGPGGEAVVQHRGRRASVEQEEARRRIADRGADKD